MDSKEHVQLKQKGNQKEEESRCSELLDTTTYSCTFTPSLISLSADAETGGGVMMMAIVIVTGPIPTRRGGGMKQMRKRLEIRGDRIDMKFPRMTWGHFDDIIEC